MPDGTLVPPLAHHHPSNIVEDGIEGANQTIRLTAEQWASPSVKEPEITFVQTDQTARNLQSSQRLEPSQNGSAIQTLSEMPGRKLSEQREEDSKERDKKIKTIDFQACFSGAAPQPVDLDLFLRRLKTYRFSISCMAFQDVWNVDLERIRDCCIHIFSPDGRLIPFCMYNLTDAQGKSLYRSSN